MSSGCGDWTAGLFHGDDLYTVTGFWRREINSVFFFFNLIWMVFYLLCFVLIMPASAFVVIFAFFPLVFVVAIHSFRTYGQELPPYIVFIWHFCFFVNMNCTAPHTLAYGFHLIGDPDWTKNVVSVFRVFCKNEKVSTCSVILIELRMIFLSLTFFVRNDKVSTCSWFLI